MSKLSVLPLLLLSASGIWSAPIYPITFQDVLASQNPADVIGDPNLFDIDYLRINGLNGNNLSIDIRFNFGGGTSLAGFKINGFAPTLNVGDLFFRTDDNTYALILNGHDGLGTNNLYSITGTQSAQTVLGNPSGGYRPNAQVWASPNGAQLLSTGSRTVTTVNNRNTNLLVSLIIPLTNAALGDLNNGFDVYFAAATCGNDELTGTVPASSVPEPGTWAMLGAGLAAIGYSRRRR